MEQKEGNGTIYDFTEPKFTSSRFALLRTPNQLLFNVTMQTRSKQPAEVQILHQKKEDLSDFECGVVGGARQSEYFRNC